MMNGPQDRPGWLGRLKDLLAWPDEEPAEGAGYGREYSPRSVPRPRAARSPHRPADVVAHPSLEEPRVQIKRPSGRQDVKEMGDSVKAGNQLILDLSRVGAVEDKRYIVAFLSGVTHGLDGKAKRINKDVYVFAPSRFRIETPDMGGRVSTQEWLEGHLLRDSPLLEDPED